MTWSEQDYSHLILLLIPHYIARKHKITTWRQINKEYNSAMSGWDQPLLKVINVLRLDIVSLFQVGCCGGAYNVIRGEEYDSIYKFLLYSCFPTLTHHCFIYLVIISNHRCLLMQIAPKGSVAGRGSCKLLLDELTQSARTPTGCLKFNNVWPCIHIVYSWKFGSYFALPVHSSDNLCWPTIFSQTYHGHLCWQTMFWRLVTLSLTYWLSCLVARGLPGEIVCGSSFVK